MEEVATIGEILETGEVHAAEAMTKLMTIDGTYEAEASSVPEGFASEVVTNLASKVVGKEEQVTLDAMETDITSNYLKSILEDCPDFFILNHISPTPLSKSPPKPSPEHNPSHVRSKV